MKKRFKNICIILVYILITLFPQRINAYEIMINDSSIILGPNSKEVIAYTLADGLDSSNIIWKSSNSNIVSVDNGVVTAIASEGSAIITASINGQNSTCKVTINTNYVPLTEIKLNQKNLNILVGKTQTLSVNFNPSDATNKDVIWKSSDEKIATVSQTGKITAIKIGTTTITATSSNGHEAKCKITVVDTIPLNKIEFVKETITMKEKSTETLALVFSPSNATNKKVTWKSSNEKIVTVDSNGKVTGITPGTATITAISKDGVYVAQCKITVEEISKKVTSVSLNKKELNINVGETETLKVTINPDYAENKKVTWRSSNEKIATVDSNGKVTAINPGIADIIVTSDDGNKTSTCKLKVSSPPLKGIDFEEKEKTVYIESETELNIIYEPENAVLDEPVWTSTNEKVAIIENGIIKALSLGETTITISTKDKKISASMKLIVIDKPKEKLNITIEGYNLNFNPDIKNYNLNIKDEKTLTINTNRDTNEVIIKGNQNLKDGSIITITIMEEETVTYIINIKQKQSYTLYFIAAISLLLLINLVRIIIKNKKTKY